MTSYSIGVDGSIWRSVVGPVLLCSGCIDYAVDDDMGNMDTLKISSLKTVRYQETM